MALVQSLPVFIDHPAPALDPRLHRRSPTGAMGAVSSMMPSQISYHDRASLEVSTSFRKGTPGSGRLLSDSSKEFLVGSRTPSSKRRAIVSKGKGFGARSYSHENLIRDWNDNHLDVGLTRVDGPPKLVPVSGQLETNIQKALIRPTAFKPVVPKSRNAVQYLSPRLGGTLSGSQGNLSMFSQGDEDLASVTMERRSSYSGARNGLFSQSFTMTDTTRNSLTNIPSHNGPVYNQSEVTKHHGHSNSDSGRSSSSKSTGSLGGRCQPLSDMCFSGHSPPHIEAYEVIVRDLEEKLRERDLALQQLRENLDENEAAICQVYEERQKHTELEMEEFRQTCAAKMQKSSQKAQRDQQLLQLQAFQLQQESKKQQEDFTQLLQERQRLEERCASYEREHTQLGPRLEETKWEVCQKSGEISLLKQQLKDLQADLSQRVGELMTLRGQLREVRAELQTCQSQLQEAHTASHTRTLELEVCENELQRRKSENELLREKISCLEESSSSLREALSATHVHDSSSYRGGGEEQRLTSESEELKGSKQQIDRLKAELAYERQSLSDQAAAFESERKSWEEEKDKVIRYQKQLQQNYIQMNKQNRALERSLRELSLELESREQDDESSGNEVTFDDIAATEI
ncbi:leucine zipper putative tumor suppressor 2 homolog [Myxocyprinus asiaticus]|uniref:leucine zipper putative tumor suppressor 2 homolog n=1 Tax=Myxocyprinus asiaticus TaxID=70543 RepID=UPI002221A940|nr:leucine zipper putative tumor suppressor 2 homolog [Myxocyprinus asiaticus]XP_051529561.1 leucine zipper putative tumor suppressor 2 homolog [Myxocyprinus asiaticus]XP_051529562.1 leucine zipper putative tumor suppressor 2 homolog [Myxocyprinus asiaticus]